MLFDVLMYPEGLRLRDKLSHGEVDFQMFPESLAHHISALCMAFCIACLPSDSSLWKVITVSFAPLCI